MPPPPKPITGIVLAAGKMRHAVTVQVSRQVFNSFLQKHFQRRKKLHVSDPNDSVRTGDVVRIQHIERPRRHPIRHIVSQIVAPWGPAIDERPPLMTIEEIQRRDAAKREAKLARRAERRQTPSSDTQALEAEGGSQSTEDRGTTS